MKFSYSTWMEGQAKGRNFVTNGPMLFASVNGQQAGSVFPAGTRELRVDVEAVSSGRLINADVIVDGEIVETFHASGDRSRLLGSALVKVQEGGWLAVRCFEEHPSTVRFAHTSPFYIGEEPRRDPEQLRFFQQWIEQLIERTSNDSNQSLTSEQRQELIDLFQEAATFYQSDAP